MNMQVKTKKTISTAIISLFIISMLSVFATVPLVPIASAAPLEDLTPDYAKAGATIDILSFDIVGPAGGTTLTSVTIAYTGDALTDLSWAAIYISTDGGPWTLFGWIWAASLTGTPPTGTITDSYLIGAGKTATVKLTFTLSGTAAHGHTVDGKVTTYTLTIPPGGGTDVPPIDPAGFTKIDNTNPTVTVTSPNGGEVWKGGDTKDITWTASDDDDYSHDEDLLINLEYSPNNGGTWILIKANEPNDGTYSWTLPLIDSDEVLVRVTATDLAGNQGSDTSDDVFTIDSTAPTISDLTPSDGAYTNDNTPTISAKLANGAAGIDPDTIVMTVDGEEVDHEWDPDTETVSYTPTEALDEGEHTVTVDASDNAGNAADTAEWSFIVDITTPAVTVDSPNGGEEWFGGDTKDITWTATDDNLGPNPISLYYRYDSGPWILIAANEPNDGTYSWEVPAIISDQVLVRVTATDLAGNQGSDTSDDVFKITYIQEVTTVDVTASPEKVYAEGAFYDGLDFWFIFSYSTITATVLDQ
ncbi:MAG: Ig-like domain-containing protein, partial [Nitrososphaerales archaeon]